MREIRIDTTGLRSWADADGREGPAVRSLLDRWAEPVTIDVAGRPGVGKSAVIDALGRSTFAGKAGGRSTFAGKAGGRSIFAGSALTEVHGVDSPERRDPVLDASLLLYVVVGSAHRADIAALADRDRDTTVVVLGRADTLSDEQAAVSAVRAATGSVVVPFPGDPAMLRGVVEERLRQVCAARDIGLLDELEKLAAARPAVREPVELLLRQPAAGALRALRAGRSGARGTTGRNR